jgi:hypothetical protein
VSFSSHCQTVDERTTRGDWHGAFIICPAVKRWRVYADGTGYSQTTGITMQRGPVIRAASGKPVHFATPQEARDWIDGGCRLTDARGNDLFD